MKPDMAPHIRSNLERLAAFLKALPTNYKRFDMGFYVDNTARGTNACAAGHGPAAGIERLDDEGWVDYTIRAFVPSAKVEQSRICDEGWRWLFSAGWVDTDNTPHGAALRIEWYLERGVPTDADAQMRGEAPLCYRPTAKESAK